MARFCAQGRALSSEPARRAPAAGVRAGMPPRRSARVAEAAERQCTALAPLPHALVLLIFSLVPVDQRLRCLEVCKGWRAVLLERSLWTCLDLSATAGLARPATV